MRVPQVEHVAEGELARVELEAGVGQLDDQARQRNLCLCLGAVEGPSFVTSSTGRPVSAAIDDETPTIRTPPLQVAVADDGLATPPAGTHGPTDGIVPRRIVKLEVLGPAARSVPTGLSDATTCRYRAEAQQPRDTVSPLPTSLPPDGAVALGIPPGAPFPARRRGVHAVPEAADRIDGALRKCILDSAMIPKIGPLRKVPGPPPIRSPPLSWPFARVGGGT
jgi:hypothetical protein